MKLEEIMMQTILEHIKKKAAEEQLDEEQIKKLMVTAIKGATTDGLKNASALLADTLRKQIPEMVAQEQTMQEEFEQRLYDRWKKALDLYTAINLLTRECGDAYVKQYQSQAEKDKDFVFGALMHIHMKACQTTSAIGVLLKGGYARDALTRQRTLHELACTALFIKKHGQETAERYWLYEVVESYYAVNQYEQHCKKLGFEPFDSSKLNQLRLQRQELLTRFGTDFDNIYGWAAKALDKKKKDKIKFSDIEKDVQLDHLRPYYRMASHGVHANSKGLIFDIGNPDLDISGYKRITLAGASNAGLADPGQSALISLYQCTVAFLTYKNDLDTLMKIHVLDSFVGEACQAFIETHRDLEREMAECLNTLQTQKKQE
jgi:Family of unknown function (DUF5677)